MRSIKRRRSVWGKSLKLSDMLPGIFQQSSFDALGLAAAAIELYFGAGECQIEPMIPKWVTGESASSFLNPE